MIMNETMRVLLSRRSIRSYRPDQVTDEELDTVIQAGLYAPSGGNRQPWHFAVVQDAEIRTELREIAKEIHGRDIDSFFYAPTIIVVFADQTSMTPVQDASLALGNMHNAAWSLGLGACWVNFVRDIFETEKGASLKKRLEPDDNFIAVGSLTLGYPDKPNPVARPRKENTVKYFR